MRVPLGWLSELVELPEDVEELARRLTTAGLEVTSIDRVGGEWRGVVVGRVLAVRPHPDADRLRLVTVDRYGEQTVVCGASNVAEGQTIAFALEGAELLDPRTGKPRKLKKSRIRGVVSGGMVCSEAELGLSSEHEGILVLDTDRPPGTPLADVLGDRVFVFDLTPNRADALSMIGIAREVSALTGAPLRPPPGDAKAEGPEMAGQATAEILAPDLCRRFTLALIEDVTPGPSPDWMAERLLAAGMRPINNLVDITNYVMLETGQPVHAFDADRVRDRHILVRRAESGEDLVTLDGAVRKLTPENLVIADPGGPVALAGVMGGLETEITGDTRRVLLEVANFHPANVRRTARRFDLMSDAARRFAWGLPPELALRASARVCRLLEEHAGGRVAAGLVDVFPEPPDREPIRLRRSRVPQVLGMDPPADVVEGALAGLGFEVRDADDALEVEAPWWRSDVRGPDDLVEEVARITGYDDLPAIPLTGSIPPPPPLPARALRERARDLLAGAGLREVQTYSLVSREDLAAVLPEGELDRNPPYTVRNPLNAGRDCLRLSLGPGLFRTAARNLDQGARTIRLFEVSRVWTPRKSAEAPREEEIAAGLLAGARVDRWGAPSDEALDFFDAKATLERLLEGLGIRAEYVPEDGFGWVSGRVASVRAGGTALGVIGQVHPDIAERFGLAPAIHLWEVDLSGLLASHPDLGAPVVAAPVSRHPAASEDFALVIGPGVRAGAILEEIRSHPLVASARVFDDWPLEEGKRSLGVSVRYQAPNRTLGEKDIAKVRRTLLKRLQASHDAVVRG